MIDYFIQKEHLCIVFELLDCDLFQLITEKKNEGLSLTLVKNLIIPVLSSLILLKKCKIIHCDLKPENIMLIERNKMKIRLIDFGSAC